MKRIIITSLLLVLTSTFCFAKPKTVYCDGMTLQYSSPWKFVSVRSASSISGSYYNPYIGHYSIEISKSQSDGTSPSRFLEEVIDALETDVTGVKIKGVAEIKNAEINGMEAKSVDINYKGAYQRLYCLEKKGYLIYIIITSPTKNIDKTFSQMLNSFSFEPE
jgi:hypothetical protein